jgi:hypothetical protein
MSQPNFYAIIPASVRYDERLKPNAKLLYGEITAMCNTEGFCWADNTYFAGLYDVSMYTISRWISQLEKCGFLKSYVNKIDGNSRKIFIVDSNVTLLTKSARPFDEKSKRVLTKRAKAIDEKSKSIYDNITINNTMNRESTALAFFEINFPSEYERLMMQFKSQITDFVNFSQMFDATCEQEGLAYDLNVLSGRFKKYALSWIRNQGKFEGKVVEMVPNGPVKKINGSF